MAVSQKQKEIKNSKKCFEHTIYSGGVTPAKGLFRSIF